MTNRWNLQLNKMAHERTGLSSHLINSIPIAVPCSYFTPLPPQVNLYAGTSTELQAFKNDADTDSPNPVIIFPSHD